MSAWEKFQRFLITVLIAIGFFYGGHYMGKRGYIFEVKKNPPKVEIINRYPPDKKIDFGRFWEVWDLVSKNYLDRPVDAQKMLWGAITGMVESLGDPYTSYLPPETNDTVMSALNGKYEGIGAELGIKDGILVVVAPLDGSPAKSAGVKSGDKILKIEEEITLGMSITDAVSKIKGPSGTKIKLTLQTDNQDPRELVITRGLIKISSVSWEDKGDGTLYIRVGRFGNETNTDWDKAVAEANVKMEELDAVIVDVRGNPGGYFESAIHLAGEFFKDAPVVWQESSMGDQTPRETSRLGIFQKVPAVFVLIDQGSASASEILAAALRDNIGAKLIGMNSFGKGTIQDAKEFSDGAGVHITVAKWLTPKKEWIHKIGLSPDEKVELTEENTKDGADPQLEKALELAKEF
ncbi:MAG TPA: S41 family peptidase [bacterium]|nr:S41 family peptidase [bacterium]